MEEVAEHPPRVLTNQSFPQAALSASTEDLKDLLVDFSIAGAQDKGSSGCPQGQGLAGPPPGHIVFIWLECQGQVG